MCFLSYEVTVLEIIVCMQFVVKKYQVSFLCKVCVPPGSL